MPKRVYSGLEFLCLAAACSEQEGGCVWDEGGVKVIELRGSWHEMGRQYGLLVAAQLRDVYNYLAAKIGELPLDTVQVREANAAEGQVGAAGSGAKVSKAREIAENLYRHYPEYQKEFFAGAAQTSGLTLDQLIMCNAVEYMEECFFCSALAAWGEWSGGPLVFGRNYDAVSYGELAGDIVITVFHPEDGLSAATIGYAGELYCVNGLNEKGIFIELNNGMQSAGYDIHWDMVPGTTELLDVLFKARTLDEMDAFFRNTRSFASFIINVADKHEARSYEWCYDGVARGDEAQPGGLIASTNHYVNDAWTYPCPADSTSWNSLSRRCNLLSQVQAHCGRIDAEQMKSIMETGLADGGPMLELTRYQMVVVPETLTLHLRVPGLIGWTKIELGKYLNGRK